MPKTRKHHSTRNKTISIGSPSSRRTLKCDFNMNKILKGRKLGEGGFGAAYVYDRAINDAKSSARYLILNKKKQYVIKVVNPNEQGVVERKYIDRAKNEARILQYLNRAGCHKSILCYKGCSERADNFYIATKYNPGYITLQDYIFPENADSSEYFKSENMSFFSRLKHLFYTPERLRQNIMQSLCEGLAEIHRRNVVHKDVKPQNILVKPANGRVKYIDFGLSCIMDDKYECRYGETPLYIPPDFLLIRDPEFKHYIYYDYWVLGVCLYFVYFRENASAIRALYKYLDIDGEKARYRAFAKDVYAPGNPEIRRRFAEVDAYCAENGCFRVSDLVVPYERFRTPGSG